MTAKVHHAGQKPVTVWIPEKLAADLDAKLSSQLAGLSGAKPSRQAFIVDAVKRALDAPPAPATSSAPVPSPSGLHELLIAMMSSYVGFIPDAKGLNVEVEQTPEYIAFNVAAAKVWAHNLEALARAVIAGVSKVTIEDMTDDEGRASADGKPFRKQAHLFDAVADLTAGLHVASKGWPQIARPSAAHANEKRAKADAKRAKADAKVV